ncbi:50S ribosome-binding GTPase [Candidatus Woesearchaeota archaeon]|nr:50S ribosome-binding GTPase [Candidatus Woesearchaeota archaeon]
MSDYNKKIEELEEELKKTKYNKATQHHIGLIKAKIAKLKTEGEKKQGKKGTKEGYSIRKTGNATVSIIGFPSVGKSSLLNKLTNKESKIGDYDFTTLNVIPGVMEYNGIKIQMLDLPGVIEGASEGKGRGKEIMSVLRTSDLILIIIDALKPEQYEIIKKELYGVNIRINRKKPRIKIIKKIRGGINISFLKKQKNIDKKTIEEVLKEYKYNNADVVIKEEINVDDLIDFLEGNRVYINALKILNKTDLVKNEEKIKNIMKKYNLNIAISAKDNINIRELKESIWNSLDLIRIYMKEPGKDADKEKPLILKKNSTIKDACEKIHNELINKFRFARATGKSTKFPNQKLGPDHVLKDEDVLELHLD